jgi:uncharacterized protein (TIGR02246 family)
MAASVRDLLAESTEAMRRGDVAAIVDLYHPNAALTQGWDPTVGREAVTEYVTTVLAQRPDDFEHEITEEHLHLVTPDLAIVDSVGTSRAGEISGIDAFTMIAVRDETGEWLWAGMRAALAPK